MTVPDLSTILLSTIRTRTRRVATKARTKGRSVATVHSFAAFVFHLGRGAPRRLSKHDSRSSIALFRRCRRTRPSLRSASCSGWQHRSISVDSLRSSSSSTIRGCIICATNQSSCPTPLRPHIVPPRCNDKKSARYSLRLHTRTVPLQSNITPYHSQVPITKDVRYGGRAATKQKPPSPGPPVF